VTYDELNAVLPSDEVTSEQIEDIMAMLTDMGINVVENRRRSRRHHRGCRKRADRRGEERIQHHHRGDRTDDPVRMYLREMGSVELLSREGEIAIAKRIEAGREAMISGLCESPLTFQAIIIWRDELNEGKILLRDIIDLEATYAGPDAKKVEAPSRKSAARKRKPARPRKSGKGGGRNGQASDAAAGTMTCLSAMTSSRPNNPTRTTRTMKKRPTCRSPPWKRS
jgi:RNA polymerase primary sigma factor